MLISISLTVLFTITLVLSKNISNNASQSVEESYLLSETSPGRGGGLGGGVYSTTTEENEYIFTTNDDVGGLDALDGVPGDSLVDLKKTAETSPKSQSSAPPPHRTIEGHHYASSPSGGSGNRMGSGISGNDHMLSPTMVTMRPPHDDGEENPVRMFTEKAQTVSPKPVTQRNHRQRFPSLTSSTSTSTTTMITPDEDDKDDQKEGEIIHLSHPENAKKPTEIESLLKEDAAEGSSKAEVVTTASTTSTSLSTASSTTSTAATSTQTQQKDVNLREPIRPVGQLKDKNQQHRNRNDEPVHVQGNENNNRRHDTHADDSNQDDSEDNSDEENRSTDYDQLRLDGVSPTMISRLDQQQHPEIPFKPIHPIISSENDYGGGGVDSTIIPMMGIGGMGNKGKLPLKFDRISPEYYDNNPWTPLLDRPNLDKRPRVEVDIGGVDNDNQEKNTKVGVNGGPLFSSTEPIIVWNSEEPEEFGGSLEYPPKRGFHNYTVGSGSNGMEGLYGQGANFTVSTYYGYGHGGSKEENGLGHKPGMVMDEPIEYPDNPAYPPEEYEEPQVQSPTKIQTPSAPHLQNPSTLQHQNEEAMNGFKPSNIPAYTILIPHIPNPKNGTTPSASAGQEDLLSSHLSPPEDYANNQYSKMDRMGVAAGEGDGDIVASEPAQQDKVTYNFEAIKTIAPPEEPKNQYKNDNDYMEDADIDEFTEAAQEDEPKIYRLDVDSVADLVPDTLGGTATSSKRPPSSTSTLSTTITTTGKMDEGSERSSTNAGVETDDDDLGVAGYVDDSFEQKQTEIGLKSANKTNMPVNLKESNNDKDFDKEFSPASMELVIGPQEPDLLIKSTTDLIMSTLGSLNLIKTPAKPVSPTQEEIQEKLRNSDMAPEEALDHLNNNSTAGTEGDPLFPPVRSYVGINQPLRPKPMPNRTDPLSSNHINKQFRFSEDGGSLPSFPPDLATTHSLQKVLSMMLGTSSPSGPGGHDESRHMSGHHPLIKSLLNSQNVTLVIANETGPPAIINLQDALPTVLPTMRQTPASTEKYQPTTPTSAGTHRDPKSFITTSNHRDSKIDHAQFSVPGEPNHVPVPLIMTEPPVSKPVAPKIPEHLTAFPWSSRPPKLPSKINHNNSPVYKFVLKKGQSVEDLLREIFSNYTTDPSSQVAHSTSQETILQQVPVKLGMIASPGNPSVQNHPGFKSLEVEVSTKPVRINHHVETTPLAHFTHGPANPTLPTYLNEEESETESGYGSQEVHTATSVVVHAEDMTSELEMGGEIGPGGCAGNETFQCVKSGKCIPSYLRCNFIKECEDNSDEEDCLCADFLRANGNARKLCDGIPDCADASDEYQDCEYCQPGQYICAGTRSCINKEQICDSKRDCQYGDDESDCVKIGGGPFLIDGGDGSVSNQTALQLLKEDFSPVYHKQGHLMVRKTGVWGKLCVESFSSVVSHWEVKDLARAVCKALTFSDYEKVDKIQDPTPNGTEPYYELHYGDRSPQNQSSTYQSSGEAHQRPGLGFRQTECKSKLVVNVTCQDLQCGVAPRAYTQRARYRVTRYIKF